jgi:hypothetical protein
MRTFMRPVAAIYQTEVVSGSLLMRHFAGFWKRGALLAALLFATFSCTAQEFRATLTGEVSDSTGALVPGATVTATNIDSGTVYKGTTTGKGVYYINYVLPGSYTVVAEAKGFKTAKQDRVTLLTAQTFNQNFALSIGSAGETVEVTGAPPQLETTTASGGTIISSRDLENVPVNGGVAYGLISTTPSSQDNSGSTNGYQTSNAYSIGGGIQGNNQFTLNGTNITSQFGYDNHNPGEWTVSPNIDSIEEVNVMTTTYDARFGRTSGGTINVVSKSGGNQWHATGRYAYQDSFLNANSYQNNLAGAPRNGELQHQFWLTGGGPIFKNKLFVFGGFEGFHQKLAGSTFANVPPAYLRPGYQGNTGVNFGLVQSLDAQEFSNGLPIFQPGSAQCLDGGAVTTCNSNHVAQQMFANDTIPGSQINATAAALIQFIPLPNVAGQLDSITGSNYFAVTPYKLNYNQPQVRVDYNLTDRTKLYSYFLYWKGNLYQTNNGLTGIAANGSISQIKQNYIATQDVTHVFSPTLTGDFKIAFDRFFNESPDGDLSQQTNPSTIGLSMPLPGITTSEYLPEINFNDQWGTGFRARTGDNTIFGNQGNPDVTNNYAFNVDFTKVHGAHTLEFGGEIDEFQYGGFPDSGGHPNGSFNFDSGWTQYNPHNASCWPASPGGSNSNTCNAQQPNGSAIASLYLGEPSSGGIDWIGSIDEGYPVYSVYFQDNWRVTPKLTFNVGLRYDVQRGLRERHNNLNRGLCLTCVNPLTNDATYQSNVANSANSAAWAAAGITPSSLQQVLGGIQFAGTDGQSRDAYNTDWSNAGPRFGFAYALNSKTVIRGGYGIMYSYGLEGGSSVGEAQSTNYTSSTDGGNTPTNYFQTGNPFASGLLKPTGNSLGLLTDVGNNGVQVDFPDRKIPIEQILSLGFQHEFPWGIVLDTRYAGNLTNRLRTFLWVNGTATLAQQNQAIANPAYFNQQVPNPYYGVAGISGPGQCGTTVEAVSLLLPLSQYCSPGGTGLVGEYNAPIGGNFYHALETKLNKRVFGSGGQGLSLQIAYTYSKNIDEDGYRNGWPYQDASRIHQLNGLDRTNILAVTSVYNLPFGKGGLFLNHSGRVVDSLVGGWVVSGVFRAQGGSPVQLNTGWLYTCSHSYKPAGGSTLGHWFSTAGSNPDSCWQQLSPYELQPINSTTDAVRNPTIPQLDMSLQKSARIYGRLNLDVRLDAFNATNAVLFGGPDTNPGDGPAIFNSGSGWSGFGTVGSQQQNNPRILQLSGKISF